MASKLSFKRADSIAESMPDALRQSRYQMKKCFHRWAYLRRRHHHIYGSRGFTFAVLKANKQIFRYVSKGRRLLKNQQLIEELDKSLDDKVEREKLVEGFLGYIICSTQVISSHVNIFCSNYSVFLEWSCSCINRTKNHTTLISAGSSGATVLCRICCQDESWHLGVCQSSFWWPVGRRNHTLWVPQVQGDIIWRELVCILHRSRSLYIH